MAFFKGIFGRFSDIFCPWMSYRSHILTQEYFFLKMWSLELYQETSYEIFIFDHIWGGGCIWKLATGDFCARSGPPQLGVVLVCLFVYLFVCLFGWLVGWLVVCLINLNKIAAVLFHNYVLLFGFRINNFRGSDQLRIHYVRVNEYWKFHDVFNELKTIYKKIL